MAASKPGQRGGARASGDLGQAWAFLNTQRAADVAAEAGIVERVEMQILHAALDEFRAQLGRYGRRIKPLMATLLGAFEAPGQPVRHAGAAFRREGSHLAPILHGQDAGDQLCVDALGGAGVAEAEKALGLEEKLRDGAACPGLELGREPGDVRCKRRGLGMALGVGSSARSA